MKVEVDMKKRQKDILSLIINEGSISIDSTLEKYDISMRTLYNDIRDINFEIREYGTVKRLDDFYEFIGNVESLKHEFLSICDIDSYQENRDRADSVLYHFLSNSKMTIERLTELFDVSRTTIINDTNKLKDVARTNDLTLKYQHGRGMDLYGDEIKIREWYIQLMVKDKDILEDADQRVIDFNNQYDLRLSDFSISYLSKFLKFVIKRLSTQNYIKNFSFDEIEQVDYVEGIPNLLGDNDQFELEYISAYILSLTNKEPSIDSKIIEAQVDDLIKSFEFYTNVQIDDSYNFRDNLIRHILSSYFRIKYRFPALNPSLNDIKYRYRELFSIIKVILDNETRFPELVGIRDEEIGFIAVYFGGYIEAQKNETTFRNRVIIVCPQGLMISKQLEIQLNRNIPNIEIIDSIGLNKLDKITKSYDYIVSTIDLPQHENVIKVNPLLSKMDINMLLEKISNLKVDYKSTELNKILETVKKHTIIVNEDELISELNEALYYQNKGEIYQPMLNELLTRERIKYVKNVSNWKEAIKLASMPLIEDGSIEIPYIQEMIEVVEEYGPYIVVTDYVAIAHSTGFNDVNRLSISLLISDNPYDMLGMPVRIMFVLAMTDGESHLKALAELSEILSDEDKIKIIKEGGIDEILNVLKNSKG